MLIIISLALLTLAGVAACGIPNTLFNLETTLSLGQLQLWIGTIKSFGIPLSLLILRFTKNTLIKVGCGLWGLFLTFLSLNLIFRISELAPSVNLYGILFVTAVLICSISLAFFSWVEVYSLLPKVPSKTNPGSAKKQAQGRSDQIERTYQTPTNPS
jgi:hypothetical protein